MDIKRFMVHPLYEVIQHQKTGWLLNKDVTYDMREIAMIASDMRVLAGRAGYTLSREANALCKAILPVAERRIKGLGRQLFIWEEIVSSKVETDRLDDMRKEFLEKHPEGIPTKEDIEAITKRLSYFAEHFGDELLLSDIKDDLDFAGRLSQTLLVAAVLVDSGTAWLTRLITSLPGAKTVEVDPESIKNYESEDENDEQE